MPALERAMSATVKRWEKAEEKVTTARCREKWRVTPVPLAGLFSRPTSEPSPSHPNAHSAYVLTNFSNLKMDALHSSERSGDLYTYVWLT